MFDAYFAPPFLQPDDAAHMASFGVTECILAVASAHCDATLMYEDVGVVSAAEHANHPYAVPRVRQEHARALLEEAGIRVFIADAISPHQEPERSWEAQWRALVARVRMGEVSVLGALVLTDDHPRAFEILDRHLALSARAGVPILVKWPHTLSAHGMLALQQRAQRHAERWYWVQTSLACAHEALHDGQGVILSTSAKVSAEDLVRFASMLPTAQRARIAIGSTRGRGLNPFALASIEIAEAAPLAVVERSTLLQGGGLGTTLRAAAAPSFYLPRRDVAL